jgi:NTP pyrophosphatase (non-canonical NTP hydrolase)
MSPAAAQQTVTKRGGRSAGKAKPRRGGLALRDLLRVMARLRSPDGGCPWDLEQTHRTLCRHAIEEVYELVDAIEAGDDESMADELGDLLLQVVFHCQMASERGAFDFESVCRLLVEKLVRRHPHVFGDARANTAAAVWAQWDRIKQGEKAGTRHARRSVLDGIPRHLPALMKAEKLIKKARRAGFLSGEGRGRAPTRRQLGAKLFELAAEAQSRGWSAEELLRSEIRRQERVWRQKERVMTRRRASD